MGAHAPALVVAMFEGDEKQRERLRVALEVMTPHMRAAPCCDTTHDPPSVRAQLTSAHADLVVWDASPTTAHTCEVLESLLQQRVFACCGLVVTTTNASQVRAFLGAAAGGVPIVQKPYPIECLLGQLQRLAQRRRPH
jgi:DNA-binding NtrC family response regulator